MTLKNKAEVLKYQMEQVDQQGGELTTELKNTIKESLNTFTPIWPESIHFAGAGLGASAETFKHRIVVITDGENDHYELTPEWDPEVEESKIMQKLAFGISFKAVLIIQTSPTERICMDFVFNLNKTTLFRTSFAHLFTKGSACVPYSQCWFYLDDLISIILESSRFKDRISAVIISNIQKASIGPLNRVCKRFCKNLPSFIVEAYDNPSSSFKPRPHAKVVLYFMKILLKK
jgi:hypothetical protein